MPISKGLRFEIFKRDGFTCQYCGRRPPEVVLECDHIHPESKGGTTDPINLITACFDCNNGKRAKLLNNRAPKPDADMEYLALQQEIKEVQRYLIAKEERDVWRARVCTVLDGIWSDYFDGDTVPVDSIWNRWLAKYSPDEIEEAIVAASPSYHAGRIYGGFSGLLRYVAGTLKHRHEERDCA